MAGEPAEGLFVIAEGSVRAFRTGMDGREQVIHVERAVTTIAEVPVFDNGDYPSTVAAEERALLLFIRKGDIRSACIQHPELALTAAKVLAARLRHCAELVESLSLREVGQRLAKLFLDEAASRGTRSAAGIRFDLKLTHNQLAARIGTVREVVTRYHASPYAGPDRSRRQENYDSGRKQPPRLRRCRLTIPVGSETLFA